MYKKFEKELNLIQDKNIRNFTIDTLKNAPDYFWVAQASSTGKYHPACTIKEGGLITHTKRVVYLIDMLSRGWGLSGEERDCAISAGILHDVAKTGKESGSYNDYINHPLNVNKYFPKIDEDDSFNSTLEIIEGAIQHHMGLWSPDRVKKSLTEYSKIELLVYTSDYISAQKDLVTPIDNA